MFGMTYHRQLIGYRKPKMEPSTFIRELNAQLTYLFAFAQKINELDTVAAVCGEFRGAQDAGWSTMQTAHEVKAELTTATSRKGGLSLAEMRYVLCLYSHLAEAGGIYEGLLNTIQVAQLKPYNLWPFQDMVRVHKKSRAIIGPNANAMFRRLAEAADSIGMSKLACLLGETFRDDIRNGIAHADYILAHDGLRLRRRNGGIPTLLPFEEVSDAIQRGDLFFELLQRFYGSVAMSFSPGRTVIGRFSDNFPMPWKVECREDGGLSISSSSPGSVTDSAYDRQQLINSRLDGRVVAAYIVTGNQAEPLLFKDIRDVGFEVLVVEVEGNERYIDLIRDIDKNALWDTQSSEQRSGGLLLLTPFGFRCIRTVNEFKDWLPKVAELEIVAGDGQ
jgi:hypothetical protein